MIASILQNLKNDYNAAVQIGLAAEKRIESPPVAHFNFDSIIQPIQWIAQ